MPTSVQTAPVIGLPQYRGWSQVSTNSSKSFVCVFAVEGDNANNFGRDLAEKILDLNPESSSELHQNLLDILSNARKANLKLQLACGLFLDNKGVFATHNGNILLKRNGQIGQIISSTTDLKIIEGKPLDTDIYVMTTFQASGYLNEIKQKLSQGFDVDTIITSVVPNIHGQDNSSLSALSFIWPNSSNPPIESDHKRSYLDENIDRDLPGKEYWDKKSQKLEIPPIAEERAKKIANINKPNLFLKFIKKILTIVFKIFKIVLKKISFLKNTPLLLRKMIPSKDVYVGFGDKKRTLRIILLTLILGLIVIGGIFWRKSVVNSEISQVQAKLDPIVAQIEEAKQEVATNPLSAREKSQNSIENLEKISQEYKNESGDFTISNKASQLIVDELTKATTFHESISGLNELEELPLFFDLRLVESDFSAQTADTNDTDAFFLDTGKSQIIKLNLEKKQSQVLSIGDYDKLVDIGIEESNLFLLGGGIHRLKVGEETDATTIKEEGDSDKDGLFIKTFGSYLYIFNPEKRNIYRYLENADGELSEPIGWLVDKQGLDFDNIKSIAVDGDLWLSTKDGQLKKYTRGEQADFTPSNLPEEITTPLIVYTKENLENLYLLEPEKRRLLVITKDGQFLREIKSDSLASATAIIANEKLGKAFAISGSVIFEVKL